MFNWISEGDIKSIWDAIVSAQHICYYIFIESIGARYIISKSLDTEFHTAPFPTGHCEPYVTWPWQCLTLRLTSGIGRRPQFVRDSSPKAASTRGLFLEKSDCQQSKGARQSAKLVNSLCVDMLVVGLYIPTALPEIVSSRVAILAFLKPNCRNLAFFEGSWLMNFWFGF